MKKTWIIVIVAIIVIAGIIGVFYFIKQKQNIGLGINKQSNADNQPLKSNGPYIGDDFTITAPSGWVQSQLPSTLVSFHDPNEIQPPGSAAAKVNFKSYIAVAFDNANGKNLKK